VAFDFPNAPSVGTVFSPAGGPSWQWNGQGWVNVVPAGGVIGNIVTTVLMTSGNYVKLAGLRFLEVWLVGPGGAGSRAGANAATTSSAGAGGGGGGMAYNLYAAADLAASEAYTIGAGGIATGGVGGAGGTSTFKGLSAGGSGGGGALMTAGTNFQRTTTRGGGGGAAGGILNCEGGAGGFGYAGMHGSGTYAQAGCGGNSFFAVAAIDRAVGSGSLSGYDGRFPGGGGSGESSSAGAAVGVGTSGANGCMIIKEFY
jgi:hypothetical protein